MLFWSLSSIVHSFIHSFFFNATPSTEIYTLSLHDALPIFAALIDALDEDGYLKSSLEELLEFFSEEIEIDADELSIALKDRKSTRLNSSHTVISYAVFCLKKKKEIAQPYHIREEPTERQPE